MFAVAGGAIGIATLVTVSIGSRQTQETGMEGGEEFFQLRWRVAFGIDSYEHRYHCVAAMVERID